MVFWIVGRVSIVAERFVVAVMNLRFPVSP